MTMDLTTEAEMLHKVPMFSKLELSKLKLLAFTSELCTFDASEVLFEAGDAPDSAYVIMQGAVEIVAETEAGPVVEGVLGTNELFGELGVLTNSPRSATIRARIGSSRCASPTRCSSSCWRRIRRWPWT